MQLKNISTIVTGGASGLGAATAKVLAAAGAKVAILDMNISLAEKIAE
jgi:NAD(P)-dependent dehydrogenase (short-subunit alcohol dehydrogenase family)